MPFKHNAARRHRIPRPRYQVTVLQLLGMALSVPDHATLSRRGRAFAERQPRVQAGTGPIHLVLDSTGLELFGHDEWCAAKHGRDRCAHADGRKR